MMENTGLVLEGGGSRGVYTGGVLRYLMEEEIYFPYIVGVSAGACNGTSYVSRQIDRNKIVTIDYANHPEFLSLRNLIKKGQLFGMDFLFDTLPNDLVPFDFDTYYKAKEEFVVGVTDCLSGEPVFYKKDAYTNKEVLTLLRASSSLPLVAPVVHFDNRILMDGGISDPIPIKQSVTDGNPKNVVILTQTRGYVKKPQSMGWYLRKKYSQYPGLLKAIENRHNVYNETLQYIFDEEKKGNIFVVAPTDKLEVGRYERNIGKLDALFQKGIEDIKKIAEPLKEFLS
ncbi:patatin-like phospholipase family protein [Robertmurraya kyonggiensis]|uniref:Patatin family protein n=1 Tax=Robertmurraya kyonggiensis TaxID=1037680 RepID=A0A4U1CXU6_9BACI|nr:patatin family protein [Robertmurraya kyonggiensis]TKC14895.1 patatin family protein [Robertmurraya kyonggiensis]